MQKDTILYDILTRDKNNILDKEGTIISEIYYQNKELCLATAFKEGEHGICQDFTPLIATKIHPVTKLESKLFDTSINWYLIQRNNEIELVDNKMIENDEKLEFKKSVFFVR